MRGNKKHIVQLLLVVAILILVNIIGSRFYQTIDLTEEGRFTLTDETKKILSKPGQRVYAQVLLAGDLPAGFKRLRQSTIDMLKQFKNEMDGGLEYVLLDPTDGSPEEDIMRQKELAKENILPVNIKIEGGTDRKEELAYPYVVFRQGERSLAVNLLESESIIFDPHSQLNNSVSLLEYKFINAIYKLRNVFKPNVVYLTGHDELKTYELSGLDAVLSPYYNTARLHLDSVIDIHKEIDLVIVPRPRRKFSEQDKFKIDQYVMNGGKMLWMVDELNVSLDSVNGKDAYVPFEYNLELSDLFFRYGFRINPDLVMDLECSRIPLAVSKTNTSRQYELFPWYYHPLAIPLDDHPITSNLSRVNLRFPSTIDTIKTKYGITKTNLLRSSNHSKYVLSPMQLNFNILKKPPNPDKYNKKDLIMALLLEGEFQSLYENRLSKSMGEGLAQLNKKFVKKSKPTSMIVISDGDVGRSYLKTVTGDFYPVGFNRYEKRNYANLGFIQNCIEYLLSGKGVLQARTKEVKLRLLDQVKVNEEKSKWQIINVALPLLALLIFGLLFNFFLKRRYIKK